MAAERLTVRLDREHRRRLSELAAARGTRISETVRQLIDEAYEEMHRANRLQAARAIASLSIEDVLDPNTLRHQLEETYAAPLN